MWCEELWVRKDPEKMAKLKDEFANGAEKQGYNRALAKDMGSLLLSLRAMVLINRTRQLTGLLPFKRRI